MKNLIGTDTTKSFFIVYSDYDKRTVSLLKQAGGRWNPEKKFWTIKIAELNNNYSLIRDIVKYAGLEVKPSAAELL